jgi:hypothetical protein
MSVAAFANLPKIRDRARRVVEADRALLRQFTAVPPHGTTVFLKLGLPDADPFLARLRTECETSAVPGKFFEMPGHIRIGMGVDHEMFGEGAKRLFGLARQTGALQ